jgi:hypothetical protein
MKKWIGLLISLLLILMLGMAFVSGSFSNLKQRSPGKTRTEGYTRILIQDEKEKGDTDPYMLQIWKEIQKKLDDWLRKLNDRIESEDVTRFGVRFLEMIRNILEWIKEKVDARIESYQKGKPIQREKTEVFRETRRGDLKFSKMG